MRKELCIKNHLSELEKVGQFIEEIGEELGLSMELQMNLNLVIEEMVVNVISYAYPEGTEADIELLAKSDGKELEQAFEQEPSVTLNQRKTIKRDTVVFSGADRYHCYVQVNPTKQKVFKSKINDDGVSVDNVYYDNSIRVSIFEGRSRIYQHDFHKEDFARLVPQDFLRQSILSDILVIDNDAESVNYNAHLVMPDSPSSYIINVKISYKGKMSMNVSE